MAESVDIEEQVAGPAQPEQQKTGKRRLPPGKLDVIYTSGFPPFWKIWKSRGMVTIQPSEARREVADRVELDDKRRKAETMAELANRDEQPVKSDQPEQLYGRSGDLPPGKLDVIYIGGIPPLRQVWRDVKAIIKERRESPPPLE